jgi:hypothetical protein
VIAGGVAVFYAKILYLQSTYWSGHPAVLIAMIVDTAELANFPADGHALEDIIFENQVARVAALGEEKILFQRVGTDRVAEDIVLNVFQGEIAFANRSKVPNPIGKASCAAASCLVIESLRRIITPGGAVR